MKSLIQSMIKSILGIGIVILMPMGMSAQQHFDKYENMKDVSAMVMTSKMFKLLSKIDFESNDTATKEYIKLIEQIQYIKVFSTESAKIGQQIKKDVTTYLSSSGLEALMTTNSDGKQVQFYTKPGKVDHHVSELLMLLEGPKVTGVPDTVVVMITGDIDLKQIATLADNLNIPGSKALKEIQ